MLSFVGSPLFIVSLQVGCSLVFLCDLFCHRACWRSLSFRDSFCLQQIAIILLGASSATNLKHGYCWGENFVWMALPSYFLKIFESIHYYFFYFFWGGGCGSICCLLQWEPFPFMLPQVIITSLQAFLSSISMTRGGQQFDFPHKHQPFQ